MGWLLWFIGVLVAVVVGLITFSILPASIAEMVTHYTSATNALLAACGLLALAKIVG